MCTEMVTADPGGEQAQVFPWNQGLPLGKVAAIDCGTNSIRLLIGGIGRDGWVETARLMRIVRLGEGVDASGELAVAAIARTVEGAREYANLCRKSQVTRLRFVATSATRDARNRDEFVSQIREVVGVEPEVVQGQEEAYLSFLGATSRLTDLHWPVLVIDIGGGSTEFVYATSASQISAISTNMGSVRLHEKFPDFALTGELGASSEAVGQWIDSVLSTVDPVVPWGQVGTLVAVAGTVTTVEALALNLDEYDCALLHGSRSDTSRVRETCQRMMLMPVKERAQLGFMPPGREDVIGAGAAIYAAIAHRLEQAHGRPVPVVVSEYDILDGIAQSLLH